MMPPIRAKKHLWQNFLRNQKILSLIVWEKILQGIHVIEVWPGPGDLTAEILKRAPSSLTLIEIDQDMVSLLEGRFPQTPLRLYPTDVLDIDILRGEMSPTAHGIELIRDSKTITTPPYHVYGNIPYYITSPIIHHFLYEVQLQPEVAVFTMQKEVADRILARDGCHTVLSLSCHLVADIEKVCDISPHNFIPVPKVWSTCLRFTLRAVNVQEARDILRLVKQWFSQKRKKLLTNLTQHGRTRASIIAAFETIGASENIRAEELSLDQWRELYRCLEAH